MKLKDVPMPPLRLVTEEELTQIAKDYIGQAPSTQALLNRPVVDDVATMQRTVSKEAIAVPNAKTKDELVAKRELGLDETLIVESIRRRPKNSRFQSMLRSVGVDKWMAAVEAFVRTPGITRLDSEELERLKYCMLKYPSNLQEQVSKAQTVEEFKAIMTAAGFANEVERVLQEVKA